jgi:hypothetical protein
MRKEFTIVIDISEEQEKMLDDIRWQHINIDVIIQEEMKEQLKSIISSIIEEVNSWQN